MKNALVFISRVNGWHTFGYDRTTVRAIGRLAELGLVEILFHKHDGQYRITENGTRVVSGFTAGKVA